MYWNEFQWVGGSARPAHWAYALVTPPAIEPITLAQAKRHLRITDEAENDQIEAWIRVARQQVEADTELAVLPQTWDLFLDDFPGERGPILIFKGPLQSVTTVKYTDSAGTLQTWASTNYVIDIASKPPRIGTTDAGAGWPTDLRAFQPGVIRFVAGWTAIELIPEPLIHAMRLLIGCMSEDREPTAIERSTYDRLVEPYALFVAG